MLGAQQLMQKYYGENAEAGGQRRPGRWGLTAEGRARAAAAGGSRPPNAEDHNDELCRICLQGVRPSATFLHAIDRPAALLSAAQRIRVPRVVGVVESARAFQHAQVCLLHPGSREETLFAHLSTG